MRWMVGIALVCAGCLSTPGELIPDDGGADDQDASAIDAMVPDDECGRDPRPATACNPSGDFAPLPYAPGAGFVLRQAVVDDVNGDGNDDLLIVENTAGSEAIYVLLGPVDPTTPQYHARIVTDLEMGEVEVRQLGGPSPCPELTVFGRDPDAPGSGRVQVWRYDGSGAAMFPSPPLIATIGFEPDVTGGPTLLAWARLHADTDDLLVADLDNLFIVHVDGDLGNLDAAPDVTTAHDLEPLTPNWDSINGIDPSPSSDCARDHTFITENRHAHVLIDENGDGTGQFQGEDATSVIPGGNPVALGTARVDLDGIEPDDVLITGGQEHGAYLLSHDGTGIAVDAIGGAIDYGPQGPNNWLEGVAVGDLGGATAPDWVGVDYDFVQTEARAVLVDGLALIGNPAVVDGDPAQVFTSFPADFIPRNVVIADLLDSGTNQAWVLSMDGRLRCLRRRTTVAALEACP